MAAVAPSGASHARTAGGAGRGRSAEAARPSNGGRSSGTTAGPLPGDEAGPALAAATRDVATSPPALAVVAAPAGRGGFSHSLPLGSSGNRRPGGTGGRMGRAGPFPADPCVAATAGAGTAPGAAANADGRAGDAADGAPTGPAASETGDGSILSEGDVVLRVLPLCQGGRHGDVGGAGGATAGRGWRRWQG